MPSIHDDLFDDAANIHSRLYVADAVPNREDILEHAGSLVAVQDGRLALSELQLTQRERALGRFMCRLMRAPVHPDDEKSPTGTKLPPLFFSPLYHFYRASRIEKAGDEGSWFLLAHIPRTLEELEAYLHEATCGVFCEYEARADVLCEDEEGEPILRENPDFEKIIGVSIHSVARFLLAIRESDPALFLLLLSFEIDAARLHMPSIMHKSGRNAASEWRDAFFSKSRCSILAVFEIIRLLRRGTTIVSALSVKRRFTVRQARTLAERLRKGVLHRGDRDTLRDINLSVFALRKIALVDIDRHHRVRDKDGRTGFRRGATDKGTLLAMTCLLGANTDYVAEVIEDYIDNRVLNLPLAGPSSSRTNRYSAMTVLRIPGAGKCQDEALCSYYGLTGRDVATLVATEVRAIVGHGMSKRSTAGLANTILDRLWQGAPEVRCPHIDATLRIGNLVFPGQGQFRHACGFARTSWDNLEDNAEQWRRLSTARNSVDSSDSYSMLFLTTRRYLHSFSYGVSRLDQLDRASRIFCHLSQSLGLLARDPVWIRMLEREKMIAGINLKSKRGKEPKRIEFGSGPKGVGQLLEAVC